MRAVLTPPQMRESSVLVSPERFALLVLAGVLLALVGVSAYSYALFHILVEGISVVVAASLFLVVFHTRRLQENDYLLFVGIGLLFFVLLDIPHALGFHGLDMFRGFNDDLPTQAYIAQRLLLSAVAMLSPLFLRHRVWVKTTFVVFSGITVVVFLSLLVWRNFPPMYVPGVGLTPEKKVLEIAISGMFLLGAAGLLRNRRFFDPSVTRLLVTSLGCFVGSEVSFTLYRSPFGDFNLIGHLFQVAAFYFVYRAVLVTALANPFRLLFRELSSREQALSQVNENLNALAEISDAAISSLDLSELAPALLGRLTQVMKADAAAIMLLNDGELEQAAAVGFAHERLVVPLGVGFSGKIALSRRPRYVADIQTDAEIQSVQLRGQGIVSVLGVPMEVGERLIGVLHVDWRLPHPYDDRDLRLLEIVGDRMALAIRNSQLYEGERRIAQIFQESLLSLPDQVDGVRYARAYHSATEEAVVGGDFFDLFAVEREEVGILIGDVSGKGIEAAVLTSLVKDTIRAHAHEGRTPGEVLSLTNSLVERYSGPETFVTAFFGLLHRDTGELRYCNAGHPPVMVLDCAGQVTELESNSPLLGAFPDLPFADTGVQLAEGETLFLYTDGVIEARKGAQLFGEERLLNVLLGMSECEPQEVVDSVLRDLMSFTGGSLSDDLAILSLRLVP